MNHKYLVTASLAALVLATMISTCWSAVDSGRYIIAPASMVRIEGGIAALIQYRGLTGEIELVIDPGGSPEAQITAAEIMLRGEGAESLWSFPGPDEPALTDLAGVIQGDGSVVFTQSDALNAGVELTLSRTETGMRLNGAYYGGAVDGFFYLFEDVYLLPHDEMYGIYLPGVAATTGEGGSLWHSDVAFFNASGTTIEVTVDYVSDEPAPVKAAMSFELWPSQTTVYRDILGTMVPGTRDTKGYLHITSSGELPLVTASTYDQTAEGPIGQGLVPFTRDRCTAEGETAYLVGLENTPVDQGGYRANVGMLNISGTAEARVWLILDTHMNGPARARLYTLAAGQFLQTNIFRDLGVSNQLIPVSLRIEVESGGPVAVYGSIISNDSHDPVLVPAQAAY
jgi:hypothetical protein